MHATEGILYTSPHAADWEEAVRFEGGTGSFDELLGEPFTARYLKLQINAGSADGPVEVAGIRLRGPGETLTDYSRYQMAAQKARPGLYPEALSGRQVYWTLIGIPEDARESLLDEYGNLEAEGKGCVLMPYLYIDGRLLSARDALSVRQSLADGVYPMPTVTWEFTDFALQIDAFGWGEPGDAGAFLRYRLDNRGSRPLEAKLFLAIRPLQINPVWQHGGLGPIGRLAPFATPRVQGIAVNGMPRYVTAEPPDAFGACAFDCGDVARFLVDGGLPPVTALTNDLQLISGALSYTLQAAPQRTADVHLAAPLHNNPDILRRFLQAGDSPASAWRRQYARTRSAWRDRLGGTTLELPDREIAETIQSQLAYILLNRDGAAIQPGSRHYERSWIRDGAMTGAALLRWGLHEPVREFIAWYAHFITPEGLVPPSFRYDDPLDAGPGSGVEWDGQGAYLSLVMDYYRHTGDREFLAAYWETLVAAMKYLETLRSRTLEPGYCRDQPAPERFRGILPKSFSHEGYYPEMHSYWDDFWGLRGWKDGAKAARLLGHPEIEQWALRQHDLLAESVAASIVATIRFKQIQHIPGCAEKGDFDPSSTSIVFFPCGSARAGLPEESLRTMYDRYYAELEGRQSPEWSAGFSPYEVRNITAFIELGQPDRAHFLLDFLMNRRRPAAWNHWAEVVLSDERMGCYIGDMPHTWVGAGFLNAIARMLVKVQQDRLVLLDGIPPSWLEGQGLHLQNRPTPFGSIHLHAVSEGEEIRIQVGGKARPPGGYTIRLPLELVRRADRITINGERVMPDPGGGISWPARTGT